MARSLHVGEITLQALIDGWIPDPLTDITTPRFVLVCDIGQGNLNVVVNDHGQPFLYYDLGGGIGGNLFTKALPDSNMLFCPRSTSRFVFSHWDDDHISTAIDQLVTKNGRLPATAWLGPEKTGNVAMSAIAKNLRESINTNGRDLHLWSQGPTAPRRITRSGYTFIRVTGKDPNNSGIGLRIENPDAAGQFMLLTGDAGYEGDTFDHGCDQTCVGLVASHHGAPLDEDADIPQPLPQGHHPTTRTIAYSYGLGNCFGHTATDGVEKYALRGWDDTYRLDTAGSESDATIGGPRGNIGMLWPSYGKGPGHVAANASVLEMQQAIIALIATCLAEIRLFDATLAAPRHIAVAAAYRATAIAGIGGAASAGKLMLHDGHAGGIARYTALDAAWKGIHVGYPMRPAHCLAIHGQVQPHIHAGCAAGVYRSIDGGATWQSLGLDACDVRALAIDPGTPTTIYAGTLADGAYKSTDGGATWGPLNTGRANAAVQALAVSSLHSDHVFAGTARGLVRSLDGGANWMLVTNDQLDVTALAIAHGVLYAGVRNTGMLRSVDNGDNWAAINTGLTDQRVQAISIDAHATANVYVGTCAGVFASANHGDRWDAAGVGQVPGDVRALDMANSGTLYAGTNAGVYCSTDSGASWLAFNTRLGDMDVRAVKVDTASGTTVYAGTMAARLEAVADALAPTAEEMQRAVQEVATISRQANVDARIALAAHGVESILGIAARISRIVTQACAQIHIDMNDAVIGSKAQKALLNAYDLAISPHTELRARDAAGAVAVGQIQLAIAALPAALGLAADQVTAGMAAAVVKALAASMGRSSSKSNNLKHSIPAALPPAVAAQAATSVGLSADVDAAFGAIAALAPATPIWPEASQPDNFNATVIAIAPNDASKVLAGTAEGYIRISNDGGFQWHHASVGLHDSAIHAIAIDPTNPLVMYAGSDGHGVYRSTNGGTSWATHGLANQRVFTVALDPATPDRLYAGTHGNGLLRSTDGGAHWASANRGLTDVNVNRIAVNPRTPATIYAGTLGGGVFKSNDAGDNWAAANTGLMDLHVLSLAIAPSNTDILYAGTRTGVFRSTDAGANWAAYNGGLACGPVTALLRHPRENRIVYACASGTGVFQSLDFGGTWTSVNNGLTNLDTTALAVAHVASAAATVAYVGTRGGGVFKSGGLATAWTPKNVGLTNLDIRYVFAHPDDAATLYACTAGGVFVSRDGADSWTDRSNGLHADVRALVMAGSGYLYAATGLGVHVSTDRGAHWTALNVGLANTDVRSLASPADDEDVLYAGTTGGVFKSRNGGNNWMLASNGLPFNCEIRQLLVDSTDARIVYAASTDGFYRTTDSATSWKKLHNGLPPALADVRSLTHLRDSKVIHLGTADGKVFISVNRGTNWSDANEGMARNEILALAVHPTAPGTVYAGTADGGVLKTVAGNAWTAVNKGLDDHAVQSVVINPLATATVYAGTAQQFVFRSSNDGASWTKHVTVNTYASTAARIAGIAAQVGAANGIARERAARAAVAATRVVVPAICGAPQAGCHRYPSRCHNEVCALSIHYFNKEN